MPPARKNQSQGCVLRLCKPVDIESKSVGSGDAIEGEGQQTQVQLSDCWGLYTLQHCFIVAYIYI